ncbi:MAG: SDR family oxidoreductase [Kofleriaceae bacterium]|nr:SDR family oxidoreductase [Myxococcales bacterium]MCB9570922.1 SDR family oxidoreductase [Kofleriaceae bacterium]
MADRRLEGHRALVTGASSGIGVDLARSLAARGAALVLTARRRDRLEAVAAELRAAHAVDVTVVDLDLGGPGAAARLWAAATADGPVDVLVNNAGFGHFRPFAAVDAARDTEMLQLNMVALVELCHALVAALPDGRPGWILNVASIAAWQAVPNFATYGASKAFVRNFSEALHYELKPRGIRVTCLCPGGTHTEFHAAAGAGDYGALARASMLPAAPVADKGVRAMLRGKKTLVTGVLNKLTCFLTGMMPRWLPSRTAALILGQPHLPLPARATAPDPDPARTADP